MPYIKQSIESAAREALSILGPPSDEWDKDSAWAAHVRADENLRGVQYEVDEAIFTLRAALGLPVPRQRCLACDARDSVYWERDPKGPGLAPPVNPDQLMWCHNCGAVEPPTEWITEAIAE